MKTAQNEAMAIYFPDYNLEWILRVEANDYAVGTVLYQVRVTTETAQSFKPIGFASKQFSEVAVRWDTIKRKPMGVISG